MPKQGYQEEEITFEVGQVTAFEPSLIPAGSASLLENLVPEETGGLRVREGWAKSSLTAGPSTAKTLGAFVHSVNRKPNYRQRKVVSGTTTGSTNPKNLVLTWDETTLSGNTLVLKVAFNFSNANNTYTYPVSLDGYQYLVAPFLNQGTAGMHGFVAVKESASPQSSVTIQVQLVNATDNAQYVIEAVELLNVSTTTPKNLLGGLQSALEWARSDGIAGIHVFGWANDLNVVTANYVNQASGDPSFDGQIRGFVQFAVPVSTLCKFGTPGGTSGIPVSGSTVYVGSVYIRTGSGATFTVRCNILWYDSGGGLISTTNGTGAAITGSWVRFSATATSPSNAAFAKIQVENTTSMGTTEDIQIDAAQFELGSSPTTWVVGSISCIDQYETTADTTAADPFTASFSAPVTTVANSWSEVFLFLYTGVNDTAVTTWSTYTKAADTEIGNATTGTVGIASAYKSLNGIGQSQGDTATVDWAGGSGAEQTHSVVFNVKLTTAAVGVDRFYVAAHDDTTNIDTFYIPQADISSGSWVPLDTSISATPGGVPVAFTTGLGNLFYTHPAFTFSRKWQGIGFTPIVTDAPPGRTCAFFKSRFFVGGSLESPTKLYYSDVSDVDSWPGLNTLEIGQDDGYQIEDMTVQENTLVVGKGNSIWAVAGSGPSDFSQFLFAKGNAAPGRSVCPTPYGACVAGTKEVYQISGTLADVISKNLGAVYAPAGNVHTVYLDDHLYVLDQTGEKVYVCDLRSFSWHVEKFTSANNQLTTLVVDQSINRQLAGVKQSTDSGLLVFRSLPNTTRTRDFSPLTSVARYESPQMWMAGPRNVFTPRWIFLQIRQRGTGTEDLTLEEYTNLNPSTPTTYTIDNKATAGPFRYRKDLGAKRGVEWVQYKLVGPSTGNQFDVEKAVLAYEEEVRS